MEIIWYGHACFRLKDRNLTVICDPYDKSIGLPLPRHKADVVTVSHDAPGHSYVAGVKDYRQVFTGAGEYEIEGVFITGIATFHGKNGDGEAEPNTIFLFEFSDLTVCHLGDLGHVLTEAQVEAMPDIDVLIIPVGGRNTLDATLAAEVISIIEPSIVIPMHYHADDTPGHLEPVERFLKEMGIAAPEPVSVFKIGKTQLPEETQVVLMDPK
ncbi:MAG: MBL fold metallo-hydrolase [Anaerolineae bacterium]|nr:MBL fold metallo-hydrolase [Anaerolineae bacterium]